MSNESGKNIVVCCDGTGNEYGTHNTNVVRLVELIRGTFDQTGGQSCQEEVVCYHPGVGAKGAPTRILRVKTFIRLWAGKILGWGIRKNITDAYKFLMHHYKEGDKVFILGFSRGAFTARALAGMLYKCGLLEDGCYSLIPYMNKIYYKQENEELAEKFKKTFSKECIPHFIGVWDTVESLGFFLRQKFRNHVLNPKTQYAYQALAIDEKRVFFKPDLWNESKIGKQTKMEQVWFAGCHSDIGGWYLQRGLSDITLKWMMQKAINASLKLPDNWETYLHPNPLGRLHESRKGLYKLFPPYYRPIIKGSKVHRSVFERKKDDPHYRPKNLLEESDYQIVE